MITVPVGVVVARDTFDEGWEDERFTPVDVFADPPPANAWLELRREESGRVIYYAGIATIDMHRKETGAYLANLDQDAPVVYVILREDDDIENAMPVTLHGATVSPLEAEAHGEGGDEIIGAVPMPKAVLDALEAFCAEHHVVETFVKRRRDRSERLEPHAFGQEPPDVVAARMKGRLRGGSTHGE